MTTICKFLEKKEILPINSAPHSFRRAFRREIARRKQTLLKEENINNTTKKIIKTGDNISKHKVSRKNEKQELEIPITPAKTKSGKTGLQINPDNTFRIMPVDPDDLPDIN